MVKLKFTKKKIIWNSLIWSITLCILLYIIYIWDSYLEDIEYSFAKFLAKQGFTLENIYIQGNNYVSNKYIENIVLSSSSVDHGKNTTILDYNLSEIEENLRQNSWIQFVSILRQLPNTLHIEIQETYPYGLWQYQDKLYIIHQSGRTLSSNIKDISYFQEQRIEFPFVIGKNANNYISDLEYILNANYKINDEYHVYSAKLISNRRWDIYINNGTIIKLPESEVLLSYTDIEKGIDKNIKNNAKESWEYFLNMIFSHEIDLEGISSIDLRNASKVFIEMEK